jgi:phytoene dehydrogenase-like protein
LQKYDSIIIGAGHNGLACAAYLAKSGQSVLVLEAAESPGGLAATREFHPGFKVSVAQTISHLSTTVAEDLGLAEHGYTTNKIPTIGLGSDPVVISDGTVDGAGDKDASAFHDYSGLMNRLASALDPFWLKTMPRIGSTAISDLATFAKLGLKLRGLGKTDMREFMRVASLPMRDLMDEYFDNELLKATLSWDGLIGSKMAPRSPNSAVLALLYRLAGDSAGVHAVPAGGIGGLATALAIAAEAAGVEIRYASPVARINVDSTARELVANAVQLEDGARIEATNIVSATDPKRTFLDLLGVEHLEIGFTNRIRRLRCDGYVAKLHLALDGTPAFSGLEEPIGRMIIASEMDAIEFAFDDAKYGQCSTDPVMELVLPSLVDSSLAPAGKHVLSANVMYVPYALKGGWTDSARGQMRERAIDKIAHYAPGIREQIIHSELLTPLDLENEYRVTGGHWHHTEFAMDQLLMMRPTYEAAQYSTPVAGLYLCGAGSHPGGDLVGAAGHNAAREVLR